MGKKEIHATIIPNKLFLTHQSHSREEGHSIIFFYISEFDIWTQGPNLADIGTFLVHVFM